MSGIFEGHVFILCPVTSAEWVGHIPISEELFSGFALDCEHVILLLLMSAIVVNGYG